jgi:TolA-binding protein
MRFVATIRALTGGRLRAAALAGAVLAVGLAAAPAAAVDAATKQLIAAQGLFERGLYDLAAGEYEAFLKDHPKHARVSQARYGLAICRYRLREYDKAAAELAAALKDAALKQREDALAVLAHCHFVRRRYADAVAVYDELRKRFAKGRHAESAAINRAQALYFLGRTELAADACRDFLKAHPKSRRRPAAGYFLALSLLARRQFPQAEKAARRLRKDHPDSPYDTDAMLIVARALEHQGKLKEAADEYRRAVKRAPKDRQAEGLYALGAVLYKARKYAEAAAAFAAVVSEHPRSSQAAGARLQLGLAHYAAGNVGKARSALAGVAKGDAARSAIASYWLGRCDMVEKKYASAREILSRVAKLKAGPHAELAAYDGGVCEMSLGRHKEAAAAFAAFRKRFPKSARAADAAYRQAFSLHKLGDYAASQSICEKLGGLKDSSLAASVLDLEAENLFMLRRYKAAAARFADLAAKAADAERKLEIALRLGQCAYFRRDYKQAVKHLAPVAAHKLAEEPRFREAAFFLGDAHLQMSQPDAAARLLDTYLAVADERKAEARFKLALAQLRGGRQKDALKTFADLAKAPPAQPWVQRGLLKYGELLYRRGKRKDATAVLYKLMNAKPPTDLEAGATLLLGWIDFEEERYDAAAKRLGELLKRHPKHALSAEAWYLRAASLREAGQTEMALAQLTAFLKAHPSDKNAPQARQLAGMCLAALGRYGEAVRTLSALSKDADASSDQVLYELAWSQRKDDDLAGAQRTYRALLASHPKSKLATPVRAELAELLYLKRRYDEAAALLERVVGDASAEKELRSVAMYRLGWCYANTDRAEKAAEAFGRFASAYPKDALAPSALYQAASACAAAGKLAAARKHLESLLKHHPRHGLSAVSRLKLGEVQAEAGDYDASGATYSAFLEAHPKSEHAYLAMFGLGWAMENRKKYPEARHWYGKVIASHSGRTAARAQFQIGECFFAEGRFNRAARELLKVDIVYKYPEWSARALLEAGRAFEQLKQNDEARRQYEACLKKYPKAPAAALAKKRLAALEKGGG